MSLTETLWWYLENTVGYLFQMLPCMSIAVILFLALRPWRRRRLADLGLSSGPVREGGLLLFAMFMAGLAALTLFPAYFWTAGYWREVLEGARPLFERIDLHIQLEAIQLRPFQEILRAFKGPWVMFLMLANIGIFAPIGFCSALLWRGWRWWKSLLLGFCISGSIEFIQFFIGRSTDIDDVILNTTGALLGFWIFWAADAAAPTLTALFRCGLKEEDVL